MMCSRIDERLLHLTGADTIPEFSAGEREHIGTCARCRDVVTETTRIYGRIARASAEDRPGQAYWASLLPRIRERAEADGSGAGSSRLAWPLTLDIARVFMPVAAVVVCAVILSMVRVEPPVNAGGGEILSTLSDAELYELRQAGKYSGLLEPVETNGEAETTLAEFIADLLAEDGQDGLYALADSEELLHQVDDAQFTRIISTLENK